MNILKLFKQLLSWVFALLPDSPFQALDTPPIAPYLSVINWIVSASFIVATMETWLIAIAAYYMISAALRWARATS